MAKYSQSPLLESIPTVRCTGDVLLILDSLKEIGAVVLLYSNVYDSSPHSPKHPILSEYRPPASQSVSQKRGAHEATEAKRRREEEKLYRKKEQKTNAETS